MKQAVLKRTDSNQFATIPNSSTTHALISMLHTWNKHTDGNGSIIRVVMFDFKKAFDPDRPLNTCRKTPPVRNTHRNLALDHRLSYKLETESQVGPRLPL